jgi:hypothetical protein
MHVWDLWKIIKSFFTPLGEITLAGIVEINKYFPVAM